MPSFSRVVVSLAFCLIMALHGIAQSQGLSEKLLRLTAQSDSMNSQMPRETIYMQLDKPYYAESDTLWFKAYVLNSSYLTPSTKSGFLYIDIADASGKLVKQMRTAAVSGVSWGDIQLNPTDFKPGAYLIRAYTTWMRNFRDQHFCYQSFSVIDSSGNVAQPLMYVPNQSTQKKINNKPGTAVLGVTVADITDSIGVSIQPGNYGKTGKQPYFLVAKARGIICYAATIMLNQQTFNKRLPTKLFPSGGVSFYLLDTTGTTVSESHTMVDHKDALQIKLIGNKPVYNPRDSVTLQIAVIDAGGRPASGNFSVSVTDDSQIKPNTSINANIITKTTENFANTGWNEQPAKPAFPAETEFLVAGQVVNVFNKPVQKAVIALLSRKPSLVSEAVTDATGHFVFKNIPLSDTAIYILQAKNKPGRMFNVDIRMDDAPAPTFGKNNLNQLSAPGNAAADTIARKMAGKKQAFQRYIEKLEGVDHHLKEVKIVAKKVVKDSKNWNGGGNADIVLDEKELEKAGKKNLLQLLLERVNGFREGFFYTPQTRPGNIRPQSVINFENWLRGTKDPTPWYFIKDKLAIVFIDGIDVKPFLDPFVFTEYKSLLQNFSAEDIKGIEVNINNKYTNAYFRRWQMPTEELAYRDFAFIEITTRSGGGPNTSRSIGNYLYKPLGLSYPSQFDSPKYTGAKLPKNAPDIRSTVYWAPNVFTNEQGNALVSFYCADSPATYTITINGTDLKGNIGSAIFKLTVQK